MAPLKTAMAFVPGLDSDVFVSYSHADNQSRWVTAFESALTVRLQELVGPRAGLREAQDLTGWRRTCMKLAVSRTREAL